MIYKIDEKIKLTDTVKKYSATHKFISGKTFQVQKELKNMGGKFDKLFKENGRDYKTKEPIYNVTISGYWIPNNFAEKADDLVVSNS